MLGIHYIYYNTLIAQYIHREAKIESSSVWDTYHLAELIYEHNSSQFLCRKVLKSVTIQCLQPPGHKFTSIGLQFADIWGVLIRFQWVVLVQACMD